VAGRKRTGPAEEVSRDADTVRLLAGTLKRAKPKLAPSKVAQIKHLVRTVLRRRRAGFDTFSEAMADIAKAAGCELRQARDNMRALENWGAFVKVAEGGGTENATWSMDGEALFRALVDCGCNPHPMLRAGLRGPERLAPPRHCTPAVTPAVAPDLTPAVDGDFSYADHSVTQYGNTTGAQACPTPAVDPIFVMQNQSVKQNENALCPIGRSLAQAYLTVSEDFDLSAVQEEPSQKVRSPLANNPEENQSITRQRDRPARAGHLEADGTSRCSLVPDAQPVFRGAVELLGKGAAAQLSFPSPNRAQAHRALADRPGGCPTADAFSVLRHLRVNGPATYGATASDMGISIGAAWRAQAHLQRNMAIEFDRIGQMVPAASA
jgi:hypothetical protein